MPAERSAGIIIFRDISHGRRYLVIRSSRGAVDNATRKKCKDFWDLPKGVLEKGEQGIDAAWREAKEEVGILRSRLRIIEGFKKTVRYFTRRRGKIILKFVVLFLAESKTAKVKLSWEHDIYKWLSYKEAYGLLSLNQIKETLRVAEHYLNAYAR